MDSVPGEVIFSLSSTPEKPEDWTGVLFRYANGPVKVPGPWKRGRPKGSRSRRSRSYSLPNLQSKPLQEQISYGRELCSTLETRPIPHWTPSNLSIPSCNQAVLMRGHGQLSGHMPDVTSTFGKFTIPCLQVLVYHARVRPSKGHDRRWEI